MSPDETIAGGPHRSPPGDLERLGWRIVRRKGRVTELSRPAAPRAFELPLWLIGGLFVLALATVLYGSCLRVPLFFLMIVIVPFLWPRRHERLLVTSRRVRWNDRVFTARFTAPLAEARLAVRNVGPERALMLGDRRREQVLVIGAAEDVQELARELGEAFVRARGPSV